MAKKEESDRLPGMEDPEIEELGSVLIWILTLIGIVVSGQNSKAFAHNIDSKIGIPQSLESIPVGDSHSYTSIFAQTHQVCSLVCGQSFSERDIDGQRGVVWAQCTSIRRFEVVSSGSEIIEGENEDFHPRFINNIISGCHAFIDKGNSYSRDFFVQQFLTRISNRLESNLGALALNKSLHISAGSLDGLPEKPKLKETGNNETPCQDNQTLVPGVFDRIDRYWAFNAYAMFYILGCYLGTGILIFLGCELCLREYNRIGVSVLIVAILLDAIGTFILGTPWARKNQPDCHHYENHYHSLVHGRDSVTQNLTQKDLTKYNSCITIIYRRREYLMANVLDKDKQVAIIGALAEGSSIRSIERMTGTHRDTIMRLGVKVGKGCAALLDGKMRNLFCQNLQVDELWGFIGKKERHVRPDDDPQYGDVWTFCAIDADTKLVPSYKVGKRDAATANAFVSDVASRLANRVQISSDALRAYVDAVELAFGTEVDYAQIIKTYGQDDSQSPERKYSPPDVLSMEKRRVTGSPNMELASTSYVERLNGTTRLHMRRLTRLTYAFSKKLENFEAAVALHFAYYNFVKRHNSIRMTPVMAAGIERDFWTVRDLIDVAV